MKKLIRLTDLSTYLSKNINTIKTWKKREILPKNLFIKIGSNVFVIEDRLNEFMTSELRAS